MGTDDDGMVLRRRKALRVYTDEQKGDWLREHKRQLSKRCDTAQRWISAWYMEQVEQHPEKRIPKPAMLSCGKPLMAFENGGEAMPAPVSVNVETGKVCVSHGACHSVWACPECAERDMFVRSLELEHAIRAAHDMGMVCLFITFTIHHDAKQTTREVVDNLRFAYRDFSARYGVKSAKKAMGYVGNIKATDFTYNATWLDDGSFAYNAHVHYHTVYFFDPLSMGNECPPEVLRDYIARVFSDEWDAAQMPYTDVHTNPEHGVNTQLIEFPSDADEDEDAAATVAEYAAKVIAIYVSKTSGKGKLTPFEFLSPENKAEERVFRRAFIDYYEGTRGVHRMVWSRGLKSVLLDDFVCDERKTVEVGEVSPLVCWRVNKYDGARDEFADAIKADGAIGADEFAENISAKRPKDMFEGWLTGEQGGGGIPAFTPNADFADLFYECGGINAELYEKMEGRAEERRRQKAEALRHLLDHAADYDAEDAESEAAGLEPLDELGLFEMRLS